MRVGITLRVIENDAYPERRDALSQDWPRFLGELLPKVRLYLLPNHTRLAIASAAELDALVLSNGNDWGTALERDELERVLLERFLADSRPVLGVCRGLQAANAFLGGSIEADLGSRQHVATRHPVRLEGFARSLAGSEDLLVNSFHAQGVLPGGLAEALDVFATSADGIVEGVVHRERPLLAIQWHPERESPSAGFDRALLVRFFEEGAFWR